MISRVHISINSLSGVEVVALERCIAKNDLATRFHFSRQPFPLVISCPLPSTLDCFRGWKGGSAAKPRAWLPDICSLLDMKENPLNPHGH